MKKLIDGKIKEWEKLKVGLEITKKFTSRVIPGATADKVNDILLKLINNAINDLEEIKKDA